jgi:mono/diheme cytochrome c family protein
MKSAMAVLWPSFIAGAVGTVLFFALLDPVDLRFVGPLEFGRKAGYTAAFFFFWGLAAGSSWLTSLLQRRADEVNRCPLMPRSGRSAARSARNPMRLASALLALLPLSVSAQDAENGKVLYETYCGGCHYERVHQRARSNLRDLANLRDAVARWSGQTKRTYTLDELENIVQYLNESHYRFGLPPRNKR